MLGGCPQDGGTQHRAERLYLTKYHKSVHFDKFNGGDDLLIYYGSLKVSDFVSLKKYNDNVYKLTYFKTPIRQKGFEINEKRVVGVNDVKLENNISRAKNKVMEYGLCNEFKYFITLTIDPKKYDRYDLRTYYKDFTQFLRNYNRLYNTKVEYVLVPEQHKDGAWHMHGLVKGILEKHLVKNEHGYLDWLHYRKKFGWVSLDPIRDLGAVSKYITKYIKKSMDTSVERLNAHLYYNSKGLKVATEIKRGTLLADSIPYYDFENDYVKIRWYNSDYIIDSIE